MGRKSTAPKSAAPNSPTAHPPIRPSFLPLISHPPDLAANVITHQQCPIRHHQQGYGPSPPLAVGTLPAHDEILYSNRAMPAAVHLDAHNLGTGRHAAIP